MKDMLRPTVMMQTANQPAFATWKYRRAWSQWQKSTNLSCVAKGSPWNVAVTRRLSSRKRTAYLVITADAITAITISTVRYTECTDNTMNHVRLSDTGHRQTTVCTLTVASGQRRQVRLHDERCTEYRDIRPR